MSRKFHRIKRLALVVAGTAALGGGAFVPTASALPPSPEPTLEQLCQNFHDMYNDDNQRAYDAYTAGQLADGNYWMAEAGKDLQNAQALGCDTSTWAGTTGSSVSPVLANRAPVTVAAP